MEKRQKIIALLTDFGTQDYFVGAMKGAILSIDRQATIVDITHEIPPQDVRAAAFTLAACYKDFPAKTIFVAVVDPGVGSRRKAILVETGEYYFIAPDNGLLSFIKHGRRGAKNFRVFHLTNEEYFRRPVSQTFHGRDIFAPVAAHLSNGVDPEELGDEISDFAHIKIAEPTERSGGRIEAEIIHIDRFGNLITNLKNEGLSKKFALSVNGETVTGLKTFYAEAEDNEIFMIFGSAGFLEIAANKISASKLLNAKIGDKVFLKKSS